METLETKFQKTRELLTAHGQQAVESLGIIVVGLFLASLSHKFITNLLSKTSLSASVAKTIARVVYVVIVFFVVLATTRHAGLDNSNVIKVLVGAFLICVAIIILIRPYMPSLPFKVGNTIKIGDLLGRVQSTSVAHTLIKTFDGKTIFVPNTAIFKENVQNYHHTPTRRVQVEVCIAYSEDILKGKRLMEEIMVYDPRAKKTPRPVVYVERFENSGVILSARCWADNINYWRTRCDLTEKIKYRFDLEGIEIALPQLQVHMDDVTQSDNQSFA